MAETFGKTDLRSGLPIGFHHNWFPLCRSRAVSAKRSSEYQLLGRSLVLFRDADGQVAALVNRCPHRNAPLSEGWVRDGRVVCPYHGWEFEGDGSCAYIPGMIEHKAKKNRNVGRYAVVEQDEVVWVFGEPDTVPEVQPPRLPGWKQRGFYSFVFSSEVKAGFLNAIENFLDGTHTHFVHAGLISFDSKRTATEVTVTRTNHDVTALYRDEGELSGILPRLFGGASVDTSSGCFSLPCVAELKYMRRGETQMYVTVLFCPNAVDRVSAVTVATFRANPVLGFLATLVMKPMFLLAALQDKRILELTASNIERFEEETFVHTELDLIRPHIRKLIRQPFPIAPEEDVVATRKVRMLT